MTTWVSAYDNDRNLSKSSCPGISVLALSKELTSCVPKTQLHRRPINFHHLDIILKDLLLVCDTYDTHLLVHYRQQCRIL
jgi:hypothetical protein